MEAFVRPARSEDADALAGLATQLGYPSDAAAIVRRLAQIRAHGIGEVFAAVGADDRVVGWTHVVPRVLLESEPFAEIAGLVVAAGVRSTGVGAALLFAAEQWARAAGLPLMRVRSNVIRERAHAFYRREGYTDNKRQVVFEKSLR